MAKSRGAPAAPRGLGHLALMTRDLETTKRFYVDVHGLGEAFEHPGMIFLARRPRHPEMY
jgi:catechol 2,3-dioxygenase-like lactoylglutathione lyase family enzyme